MRRNFYDQSPMARPPRPSRDYRGEVHLGVRKHADEIMLDDVGPALPEVHGGPIHAPTLARIANSGISYNSFHNAAM